MDVQYTYQVIRERIAASQEQAVARGRKPECSCKHCVWRDGSSPAVEDEEGISLSDLPCRVCEVAWATGGDGLCDGCRGARLPEVTGSP